MSMTNVRNLVAWLSLTAAVLFVNSASFAGRYEDNFDRLMKHAIRYEYSSKSAEGELRGHIFLSVTGEDYLLQWHFPRHGGGYRFDGCMNHRIKNEPNPENFHFCITSGSYNLTVPRDLSPEMTSWFFDGWEYKLLQSDVTYEIGDRVFKDVYVIAAPPEAGYYSNLYNYRMVSFYSKQFGLLAFQVEHLEDDDKGPLWLLDGEIGVGAMVQEPLR